MRVDDEFVHVDDENSEEFSHEILDYVNDVLERMQTVNDTSNEDESNHITMAEACTNREQCHVCFAVRINTFL